jgi:glucan phosphoethanolaminetransferase (alkaline phosphatase superfamily)
MTPRLLRLVYAFEFLIALVAIFTVWSEVGGQAALDLMHWGWKLGLSFALALSFVLYTAAIVSEDSLWSIRSARWLALIMLIFLGMGAVTYYYAMQADTGESDETGTISAISTPSMARARFS